MTLDGLRGIAALMVVFYHIYGNLADQVTGWIPQILDVLFRHGYLGVQVFFVLSGFAIASSFSDSHVTGRYVGLFALKRSIRLDPPYWASIAVAISLGVIASTVFAGIERDLPSTALVLAHLLYLQNLLDMGDIVPIYWTLCLEIQFYLLLALVLYITQSNSGAQSVSQVLQLRSVRLGGLALLMWSVATYSKLVPEPHPGTFIPFWFYFQLGLVVYWYSRGWITRGYIVTCFVIVAGGLLFRWINVSAGMVTACFLLAVLSRSWTKPPLSNPVSQYFGRISYSLYLFHPTIGWSTVSLGKRLAGSDIGPPEAVAIFGLGVAVSVLSAHVVYRLLERPSQRFSRRFHV